MNSSAAFIFAVHVYLISEFFFNSVINIKENTACDLSMHEMYLII